MWNISDAKTARVHGGEISFNLPKEAATKFQKLFGDLDKSLTSLHIRSYGIAETSLEEIFLKLAEDGVPPDLPAVGALSNMVKVDLQSSATVPTTRLVSPKKGTVSYGLKFLKLCKIRFLLAMRSKLSLTLLFILPLILFILVGVLLKVKNDEAARALMVNYVPMWKFRAELNGTKISPASNDKAEKNAWIMHMVDIVDRKFDHIPYEKLNQTVPHFISFNFDKQLPGGIVCRLVYNSSARHILPYATNLLLNAIYREMSGKEDVFDFAIHPFADAEAKARKEAGGSGLDSFLLGLALLLVPGIFCYDVCRDRTLRLRSQIRMTSCPMWLYWGSAFFSHFVQYLGTFGLAIIVMYAFKVTDFTNNIGPIIVLFLLHAPAVILFCYCLSFAFKKHTTAMVAVPFPMALVSLLVLHNFQSEHLVV